MRMQEFYRLFENGLLITRMSLAREASKLKLVHLYLCCSLIYCYYLLTVLLIDLFTLCIFMAIFACWMLLKDLRITLFGAGIFIPVNMIQDWFQFSQIAVILTSVPICFYTCVFQCKKVQCGSWGRFSTTCKAQRRFQNALTIHLSCDENLDKVEVTLIISVPSGAFLANFKGTLKFFFVKQYENLKIRANWSCSVCAQ